MEEAALADVRLRRHRVEREVRDALPCDDRLCGVE
jgi:hypothetical protein